ncbi:hypothetical protein ACI3L1_07670 [Deinococcus sp. SM5_A1]
MQALLGSFSGQFGKNLILGTLLPVAIILAFWIVVMEPLLPNGFSVVRRLALPSETWQLGAFAFLSVVITALLSNANYALVRLLEGYPWKASLYGHWRQSLYVKRLVRLQNNIQALVAVLAAGPGVLPRQELLERQLSTFRIQLNTNYPPNAQHVLPTRLGNIIRAFEVYPSTAYGLDGIIIWPALAAIMPKSELEAVNESRTSFDFAVQLTVLAASFGLVSGSYALAIGFLGEMGPPDALPFILAAGFSVVIAIGIYRMACVAAVNWGTDVRRAVDLNRQALWTRFGISEPFGDVEDERPVGVALSQQLIYGDQLYYESVNDTHMSAKPYFKVPSALPATVAITRRGNRLTITRSVRPPPLFQQALRVQLRVQGFDDADAIGVTLRDTLPPGWVFRTDSATIDGTAIEPRGSQVLTFALGDMAIGTVRIVEYDAFPLSP